ncbi:hypothetical protein fugu_019462 [Takifugu bimaculatus]|uniref:long-chain-fatty-acid--CoA ligase n=1 Tax=Takifugu bimaculatus TaxID=433685 RepID=A0A4Z2BMJ0_9TELE|nr:hypothetical protein fugu_019462 [Takifugu bimaculatus]
MEMIATVLTSVFGGLLALLLYQRAYFTLWWKDLLYYFKLRQHKKRLQARLQLGIVTYLDCFLQQTRKTPSKPFIIFEDQVLTYQDVDRRSNRFANVLRRETQVTPGAVVALWMFNHPDFICVWLGLCKLGCQAAFLNTNIKPKTLAHCMHSCGAQLLLSLLHLVEEALPDLGDGVSVCVVDHTSAAGGFVTLSDKLEQVSEAALEPPPRVDLHTDFLIIFTSGTTGLSKAVRVAHLKAISSMIFFQMCGATSQDIIYITLPLYHMSASLLGIGGCIQLGATCVLKRKFSASQFWKDCVKYNVTVILYIGELCRYLVNHPSVPEEKAHKVHLAAGSGLRSDVWKEFRHRFGKITIREGYGLTEASIGFLNYTDEVGPIGRASCLNKLFMPFELLRFDPQTYEPVRTVAGRCLRAQRGEAGLLVAPLVAVSQFLGYAGDKAQSEKKLLRDVLKAGDIYFNTGDLLFLDKRGFLYFHDRVGDTFRWKGENVSTTEVSEVLGLLEFIQEANVYGVTIPGCEGRAGMAAVVLKQDHHLDGKRLHKHLVKTLPAYAWPRFLRIQNSLDVTETFKQQKTKLVQEAFNPCVIQDPLYFLQAPQEDFIPLTASLYHSIVSGEILL